MPSPTDGVVTLAHVAARAGVSPATATRALNGHPRVRPETRARVEAAVAALGYVPHLGARALATRSSRTIGLLLPSSRDGFWGAVAEGIEARATDAGFSTLLAASHSDPERERAMIELFLGKRVDGIVVGSSAGASWMPRTALGLPMVLVNWDADLGAELLVVARDASVADAVDRIEALTATGPTAHVRTDDLDGAAQATRHLIALGHRRIAFVGLRSVRPALLRLLGYRRTLDEAGLAPALVLDAPATLEGGRAAGAAVLGTRPRPTAVVAFDDMVAVGVIRAAHAAGLRVPEDLSIVGFDDVAVAAFLEPPLTTVAQDTAALGGLAVDIILGDAGRGRRGAGDRSGDAGAAARRGPNDAVVPGRLVIRDSTGRAQL